MCDNFEYIESTTEQSLMDETVFKRRDINYITDINNGVYQQNGTCLVSYNLGNIYNNEAYLDNEMFIVLPITCERILQKWHCFKRLDNPRKHSFVCINI